MSTFLELVRVVQRECSVSGGQIPSVLNQTGLINDLVNWVSDADFEIQSLHGDWDFLWSSWSEPTIVGIKDYSKPTSFNRWDYESFMIDYTSSTHQQLERMDYKVWRRRYRNGIQTNGKPSYFVVRPDKDIILHNPPDAVYTLTADYWTAPTRLSTNTQESPIPEMFERAIISYAKMKFAEDQGIQSILSNAQVEFGEWVTRLESDQLPGQEHRRTNEAPIDDNFVIVN